MDCAAICAGSLRFVLVKRIEQWGQVLDDILDLYLDTVDKPAAVKAEPLKAVFHAGMTGTLDHQTYGASDGALR